MASSSTEPPSQATVWEKDEVKKTIVLKSSDKDLFEVDVEVASMSETLKQMMEDDIGGQVPVTNVSSNTLAKVIEYCRKHAHHSDNKSLSSTDKGKEKCDESTEEKGDLQSWDKGFIKVDLVALFDIISAANYLNIKSLLDLTSETIADRIQNMTVEEVRQTFNIENDFTPQQEARLRNEYLWAFL